MGRVLVGVDGSMCSVSALRWAAGQARNLHAELVVMHAWQEPSASAAALTPKRYDAAQRDALELVRDAIASVDVTGLAVQPCVTSGPAGPALLRRARQADLLVVGVSGQLPPAGMLLGSVAQHCTRHSRRPVVVVPAGEGTPSPRYAHAGD